MTTPGAGEPVDRTGLRPADLPPADLGSTAQFQAFAEASDEELEQLPERPHASEPEPVTSVADDRRRVPMPTDRRGLYLALVVTALVAVVVGVLLLVT